MAAIRLDEARGRWVVLATVLGSGVASLDATVVNIALPAIGRGLHAGLSGLQWTLNGYTLTLAACILLGGSLGDLLGRRRVFLTGAVGFAVASVLCAVAPTIGVLVGARLLQGVAGALLTPGSLAILAAVFEGTDRARAIGLWSGFSGLTSAAGPFVGGWLIDALSWRWIFVLNVPLVAVVVLVTRRHVPETRDVEMAPGVDVPGAVSGALALGAATYGLIAAGASDPAWVVAGCLLLAVAAGAVFAVVERRGRHPMLPLDIFASRRFTATNAVTFVMYGALAGVFFVLVLQLQLVSGFGPLAAGAALLPITALMLVGSSRAGQLAARFGPRPFMTAGPVVGGLGLLLLLRVGPGAGFVTDVLPAVLVFGVGLTTTVAPLTATVLTAAPARHAGVASGVNNAVARTAGLLAVAVLPLAVGLGDSAFGDPGAFDRGFHRAVVGCAAALVLAGVLSAVFVGPRDVARPRPVPQPG